MSTMSVSVLYGLGGMGKTEIATEFVYRNMDKFTSVFWIHAADIETIKKGFVDIARRLVQHEKSLYESVPPDYVKIASELGLHGLLSTGGSLMDEEVDKNMDQIVDAVQTWFSKPGNIGWLLVLDNMDDVELFEKGTYFPRGDSGMVIVTSRRKESEILRSGHGVSIDVGEMDEESAVRLLDAPPSSIEGE